MRKSTEAAKALLEDMTCKNYHWSSERATPKRRAGRYEVDVVTLLANRMDALAQRLDRVGTRSIPAVLWGHQGEFMLFVRLVVCKVTHLLSATMFPPLLSTLMLCIALTPHHRIILTPLPTIKVRRVTQILSTKTTTLNPEVLCSRPISNIELSTTYDIHLFNSNPTWRVSWSVS